MIIDNLKNAKLYYNLNDRMATAFNFLAERDLSNLEVGKYEIAGDDIYASVEEYQTKPKEEGRWEGHRKYLDIQYIIEGQELMGCSDLEGMKILEDYNQKKDILFLEGEGDFFTIKAGNFAVFMPQDIHMPGRAVDKAERVKKVVVKVKLD
ncbi:YhcH/YjgK/YiaL family protein [Orenia metallireducens]|uniref:YhcH/YjgK/YiaL family protein n=1 Tax=Orenia metallireducens TaxID=1413210 RepID=A0A285H7T3_9FIRM|nr:YhcH/YjgK/YiaL family protein [Orenia metallireducens]PRX28598.1 YhcH/YjgK/YiaL family protein [Orenia metallireducens]SNY30681.1 YhcH/YjgK/YiaL family protein [Orenia metallireducens]